MTGYIQTTESLGKIEIGKSYLIKNKIKQQIALTDYRYPNSPMGFFITSGDIVFVRFQDENQDEFLKIFIQEDMTPLIFPIKAEHFYLKLNK